MCTIGLNNVLDYYGLLQVPAPPEAKDSVEVGPVFPLGEMLERVLARHGIADILDEAARPRKGGKSPFHCTLARLKQRAVTLLPAVRREFCSAIERIKAGAAGQSFHVIDWNAVDQVRSTQATVEAALVIPLVVRDLFPTIAVDAFLRCARDPAWYFNGIDVCETCYLEYTHTPTPGAVVKPTARQTSATHCPGHGDGLAGWLAKQTQLEDAGLLEARCTRRALQRAASAGARRARRFEHRVRPLRPGVRPATAGATREPMTVGKFPADAAQTYKERIEAADALRRLSEQGRLRRPQSAPRLGGACGTPQPGDDAVPQ